MLLINSYHMYLTSTFSVVIYTIFCAFMRSFAKGAYIKYKGGWWEGREQRVSPIFLKKICSPGDHRPKYFMTQQFFTKIFHDPSHQFQFLKAFLQQNFRVVLTVIFKFQIIKKVNMHNSIQKIIFKQILQKKL